MAKKTDGTLTRGFLYAPGLIGPVTELAPDGSTAASFIYATRPNVPDYMVKAGGRPSSCSPSEQDSSVPRSVADNQSDGEKHDMARTS